MATWQTYDQVGIKEDVSDVIHNISPTKVPFQSSLQTFKVKNRLFEWQEDSLANQQDNAQLEGFDATEADLTATTLRSLEAGQPPLRPHGTAQETVHAQPQGPDAGQEDRENNKRSGLRPATAKGSGTLCPSRVCALRGLQSRSRCFT